MTHSFGGSSGFGVGLGELGGATPVDGSVGGSTVVGAGLGGFGGTSPFSSMSVVSGSDWLGSAGGCLVIIRYSPGMLT